MRYRIIQYTDRDGFRFYRAQKRGLLWWKDIGHDWTHKESAHRDIEIHKNKVVYEERV